MEKEYKCFVDPAHAWLQVTKEELRRLDIADKITSYSYQWQDYAYLEEDCDMAKFLKAKEAAEELVKIIELYHDSQSEIRNYKSYTGGISCR